MSSPNKGGNCSCNYCCGQGEKLPTYTPWTGLQSLSGEIATPSLEK